MKKINEKFDCLKDKEKIQTEISKEISGKPLSEERAFYNSEVVDKKLTSWVDRVKRRSQPRGKLRKTS